MLTRFHRIPERNGRTDGQTDRRTDRQTDRIATPISRVSMLTCDKNCMYAVVYQIFAAMYKKAGVEPPTYAQFRQMKLKLTRQDKFYQRNDQYEDQ